VSGMMALFDTKPVVNFYNILRAAFSPLSFCLWPVTKKYKSKRCKYGFYNEAVCKMLMKLSQEDTHLSSQSFADQ
jgi:hypothetical protein